MTWPRYMIEKRLRAGGIAYYWNPPVRDIRAGFPLTREALGSDFGRAVERTSFLNTHLLAWRQGRTSTPLEFARPGYGTVAWLFDRYLKSKEAFADRVRSEHARYEYRRACKRVEEIETKTGGRVAELPINAITPAAVDKIYTRLKQGPRGHRIRQANLSMGIAARAWDAVWRMMPSMVPPPGQNPWRGAKLNTTKKTKPAATRAEAYALAGSLNAIGEPHLGAAALICFEWHQRPEHVRAGDITWADWRPPERPNAVQIRHPKTGAKGWIPLEDSEGPLFGLACRSYSQRDAAVPLAPIPRSTLNARCARPVDAPASEITSHLTHVGTGD
jgi:hypothetical protein